MPGRPRDSDDNAGPSSSKRPCFSAARGAITKIRVHNFMTYKDAEIIPGPRLNLVLGPNGTGKSTLVNAICLGLAGATQLLGRADNVRDFVRRGESEGYVQIWLSTGEPGGRTICIKRNLKASDNSSEWRINGGIVHLKDVKERVKELHVQLDNLCQFLPQDKVVEFAKLKPGQLLEETEKAIGDATLYKLHQELIQQRNELRTVESAARASKQELEVLERTNDGLKRDVQRVEQRAELEKKVLHLEDKLLWTKFKEFKKKHQNSVGEYQLNEERLQTMRVKAEASAKPRRDKEERQTAAANHAAASFNKLKKAEDDIMKAKEELDRLVEEIDDKHNTLESLDDLHERWQAEIRKHEADLAKLQEELAEMGQSQQTQTQNPEHTQDLKRLNLEKKDAVATINALQHNIDVKKTEQDGLTQEVIAYLEQMRRLTNVRHQRLRILEQMYRGITKLAEWLEKPDNKALFRGRVYGPILCEVHVDSAQNAAWLEQHCPRDLWARFVTEQQEDQDKLAEEAKKHFNFRPIITNFTGSPTDIIKHRCGDASRFASAGTVSTLDEVFQAPHTIKLAMCNEAALNETYCGNSGLNAEQFLEHNPAIMRLMTPESVYGVRKSRYNSAARSTTVTAMRNNTTLLAAGGSRNVDEERRALQDKIDKTNEKKDRLQAELDSLNADLRQEEERSEGLAREIKEITDAINAVRNKRNKMMAAEKTKDRQLAKARAKPDPRDQAEGIQSDVDELCKQICKAIAKLADLNAEVLAEHHKHVVAEVTSRELMVQIKGMEKEQKDCMDNLRRLESLMATMLASIEEEKPVLQKMKKAATDRTGPMSQEIKNRFAELPTQLDDIENAIVLAKDRMEAIELANPGALDEYNKRKQDIEKLRKAARDQTEDVDVRKAAIEHKKARWLPELQKIVGEINKKFGRSFQRIGCAGEVLLHEARDPETGSEDFDKFAIHIKVRFRVEEGLQLLTAHRQSGGERSVSTILYLIAIQNVTVCPFRVVDEINQGMDPVNERKVFMQLAEAACQPNTPQCFLLTPKLLPDLPFSDQVTLLQIFNGPLVADAARHFSADKVLGKRPRLVAV